MRAKGFAGSRLPLSVCPVATGTLGLISFLRGGSVRTNRRREKSRNGKRENSNSNESRLHGHFLLSMVSMQAAGWMAAKNLSSYALERVAECKCRVASVKILQWDCRQAERIGIALLQKCIVIPRHLVAEALIDVNRY